MNESPKRREPGTHSCPRVKSTRRRGWKSERERKKRERESKRARMMSLLFIEKFADGRQSPSVHRTCKKKVS